jgi:hypothetical protein
VGFLVRQVVFRDVDDTMAASRLDGGPDTGVICDPGPVGLWTLESILTGRDPGAIRRDSPDPVAIRNQGQRVVLPLSDALRDTLARQVGLRGALTAARWSKTDEVRLEGLTRPSTRELLRRLQTLARAAQSDRNHLYLWIDVDPAVPG